MSGNDKKIDPDEVFEGDEMLEEFMADVDENGLAMATMNDGHAIGFTLAKLLDLVDLAKQNTDNRVILFIRSVPIDEPDDSNTTEWKN